MHFNCVIIDDEKLAREDLKALLSGIEEIKIIGEAGNANEAKKLVDNLHPDIIFLDIQMPGKSGFELLSELKTDAQVIFVTAYDEYAIKAFEVNAQDYLLKPVNRERLQLAIEHLKEDVDHNIADFKKFDYEDNVFLMINNSYQFIKINTIQKITSAGNYSEIFTTNKVKGLVLKSMKEWELRLPENHFVRVHRNSIINLEFVDHIEEWFNYAYQVYIKSNDKPIIMSRRYAALLKDRMS
jgi:two-component system, LytTR family, response regulator